MARDVPVRVTTDSDVNARFLTDWPADDLEGVLNLLRIWGVSDEHGESYDVDQVEGEFIVGSGGAYFRVYLPTKD